MLINLKKLLRKLKNPTRNNIKKREDQIIFNALIEMSFKKRNVEIKAYDRECSLFFFSFAYFENILTNHYNITNLSFYPPQNYQ